MHMSTTQIIIHTRLILGNHITAINLIGEILWRGVLTLTAVRMVG